ncbi:MAG: BamA/TamA family outer membrane protein [Chthoniobacteraceae bacterium]
MNRALLLIPLLAASGALAQNENLDRALAGADLLLGAVKPAAESKVQFSGATSFTDEELRAAIAQQIQEIDEKGVTPARADDAAYYIGSFYRKAGFAKAQTDYAIAGDKVTVKIVEGPRSLLRGLSFAGNATHPDATLFEYMIGVTPEQFEKEPDMVPFNEGEIAAGADRVRGFYISEGHLDAKVDASGVKLSDGGTRADVAVRIVEGRRYTVGDIVFTGETIFPRDELLAALREPQDGPFSRTAAVSMQRNLESFYKSRGYYLATVALDAEPASAKQGRVPVRLAVKPGALHRFDGVTAKNTTGEGARLRESFLPRRFRHLTGKTYDPKKVDATYRELMRSGLFTNLRMSLTAQPDDTVRIDLLAEEAKSREIGFTLGFGTYDGFKVGLQLADRNLLGTGRPLTFSADYSQRGLGAELMYFDPWFLDSPRLNLRAKVFRVNREEEGYRKEETGYRADLAWKILPRLEAGVFLQQSTVKISEPTIDPLLLGPTDYTLTSIGTTQSIDFRDSPMAPTRGWVLTTAFDVALVDGEQSFTREVVRFSCYLPVAKCQLALGARVGAIQPIAATIPIDARFFNGGATTVRSFAERELGPLDASGNPLGGEFYTAFNAEFTFPLGVAGLQGAVFADAGNLTTWEEAGITDMRYALGIGLRYALPVGIDAVVEPQRPDRREGEDLGAFHFSFGVAF